MTSTTLALHYNEAYAHYALHSTPATLAADKRAAACAALHVGIDAMSRIAAKRPAQAGCVASYPPIVRRSASEVRVALARVAIRHWAARHVGHQGILALD